MATDQEVAATIRQQVGVGALMRMGAHKPGYIHQGFTFKLGGKRQTWIRIQLNAWDTYDVEMVKIASQGRKQAVVKTFDSAHHIYADQLAMTALRMTGEVA